MSSANEKRKKEHALTSLRAKTVGMCKTLALYILFFLLSAYLSFLIGCPAEQSFIISVAAFSAASFAAGFFAAGKAGKQAIPVALWATAIANAAVLVSALAAVHFQPDLRLAITAAFLFLSASLGGVLGVNHKKQPRHRPQKGRRK